MIVIKKDGQKVEFDSTHVYNAVKVAAERTDSSRTEEENEKLASNIELLVQNEIAHGDYFEEGDKIESSEIQDLV